MDRRDIREQQRGIKSSNSHLGQEIKRLEFQKNKLLQQIKTLASKGNHAQAKPLAKQVTQINQQIQKLQQFSGQMTAVNYKVGNAASMGQVANAMGAAGQALQVTNQNLDTQKIKNLGLNMQKQNMKLDMKSDMMEDALDFGDDLENDEEANDIYNQVMQEAGYNTQKAMPNANNANLGHREMNMNNRQRVAVGVGNQGNYNYNQGNMRNNNNFNNNNFNNNNFNNNNFNKNNNNFNYNNFNNNNFNNNNNNFNNNNFNNNNFNNNNNNKPNNPFANPFANPFGNSNPYH